jgi:hypothetical protein
MAIPWLLALKVIPWTTILANAPAIARSADALLRKSKTRDVPATASRLDVQALADRIAVLEQHDRDTAELLTRVTGQIDALTAAGEVLQARAQWLLVIAVSACIVSVVACVLALAPR